MTSFIRKERTHRALVPLSSTEGRDDPGSSQDISSSSSGAADRNLQGVAAFTSMALQESFSRHWIFAVTMGGEEKEPRSCRSSLEEQLDARERRAASAARLPPSSPLCLPRGMENSICFILNVTKTAVTIGFF